MINTMFNLLKIHKKSLLMVIIIMLIAFSFAGVYSTSLMNRELVNFNIGKNHIIFNLTEPFYARDLVKWNPEISVVSYTSDNKTIGYVNLFNGIGENFIIENNKPYEIISNKNISLVLPFGTEYLKEVA